MTTTAPRMRPLSDRVLLRVLDAETETSGGIILPDVAQEKSQEAEVLAVGPGRELEDGSRAPMQVKVGDRVLFGKYGGDQVGQRYEPDETIIVREGEILAVLDQAAPDWPTPEETPDV